MSVELNHTIVWASDKQRSAEFLSEILALPEPFSWGRFAVVQTANGVSLDFTEKQGHGPILPDHYAFLVSDGEFDAILERITTRGLDHWADPALSQPSAINHREGGKGVYFLDPDGHILEVLTVSLLNGAP